MEIGGGGGRVAGEEGGGGFGGRVAGEEGGGLGRREGWEGDLLLSLVRPRQAGGPSTLHSQTENRAKPACPFFLSQQRASLSLLADHLGSHVLYATHTCQIEVYFKPLVQW